MIKLSKTYFRNKSEERNVHQIWPRRRYFLNPHWWQDSYWGGIQEIKTGSNSVIYWTWVSYNLEGQKERDLVVEQIADSGAVFEPKLRRFGLICLAVTSFPPWLDHSCWCLWLKCFTIIAAYWAKIMGPLNWPKIIVNTRLDKFCLNWKVWIVNPPVSVYPPCLQMTTM